MHLQPITGEIPSYPDIPDLACACATLRRAARAVSHLYAEEFEGLLEGTQFSLLAVVNKQPGVNQMTLGRILVLDKTTLSRNLSLMKRHGWIQPTITTDKRERGFELTAAGHKLLQEARTGWQLSQQRLLKAMGEPEWARMFTMANSVTRVATAATEKVRNRKGTGPAK